MRSFITISIINILFLYKAYSKNGIDIKKIYENVIISLKEFTLSPKEIKAVHSNVKARLDSNLICMYTVKKVTTFEGYVVLIVKNVRTKNYDLASQIFHYV